MRPQKAQSIEIISWFGLFFIVSTELTHKSINASNFNEERNMYENICNCIFIFFNGWYCHNHISTSKSSNIQYA